jgi:3-deoxy-D-manno-octulosonic-acid transferase
MNPWLRAPYAGAAQLAEWIAATIPSSSSSKLGRTFAARHHVIERYERWGRTGRDRSRPLLWVHAPSVGEGLMALPVIQRVRQRVPAAQIVYTFFSPSAERFTSQTDADFTAYLPFDTVQAAELALDALQPTALLFSKLDVWPVLVERAHRRGVRLGLISASIPLRSSRRGIGATLTRDAYSVLDRIGAASTDDARHLIEAGARSDRISVTGDTRYDQAWERAHIRRQNETMIGTLRSQRITLVAGSTWPADESQLLPAWEHIVREVQGARLIVAPHEIHEAQLRRLEEWALHIGASCARLGTPTAAAADVLIVDRVGVLPDLYALADVAYVGGGFHSHGLHSLVEPAVSHVPIIIGPRYHDSRDARMMLEANGAIAVQNSATMTAALRTLANHLTERNRMAASLETLVSHELGAADRSFQIAQELLGTG